jgi:hypothetical protein
MKLFIGFYITERTHFPLSIEAIGTFYIEENIKHTNIL